MIENLPGTQPYSWDEDFGHNNSLSDIFEYGFNGTESGSCWGKSHLHIENKDSWCGVPPEYLSTSNHWQTIDSGSCGAPDYHCHTGAPTSNCYTGYSPGSAMSALQDEFTAPGPVPNAPNDLPTGGDVPGGANLNFSNPFLPPVAPDSRSGSIPDDNALAPPSVFGVPLLDLDFDSIQPFFAQVKSVYHDDCTPGSGYCFIAGEQVIVAEYDDLIFVQYVMANVETIKIGDKVLAKDHKNPDGPLVECTVINTFVHYDKEVATVTLTNPNSLEPLEITGTLEHPFYVQGKGFIAIGDLELGDICVSPDGSEFTVTNILLHEERQTVYNFEVEGAHTYYVGTDIDNAVLVHNLCDYPDTPPSWFPGLGPMAASDLDAWLQYISEEIGRNMPVESSVFNPFNGPASIQIDITIQFPKTPPYITEHLQSILDELAEERAKRGIGDALAREFGPWFTLDDEIWWGKLGKRWGLDLRTPAEAWLRKAPPELFMSGLKSLLGPMEPDPATFGMQSHNDPMAGLIPLWRLKYKGTQFALGIGFLGSEPLITLPFLPIQPTRFGLGIGRRW